ncbi:hypothetical protein B0A55_08524 [Friedmanniomyces simplex]|uniref:Uncharacterized protein n=1 Tax=Friedmanniomyces simplex TaxID=329884 RepID=A0A4U0WZE1_9PEZI|nr:hypothetical protein B0A55_08524 [Friedmanniomyces simplex]
MAPTPEAERPTSFFGLPLELRQQIYQEILPDDGALTVHLSQQGWARDCITRIREVGYKDWAREQQEWTLHAVCQAHPRLKTELCELASMKKDGRRFVFSPTSPPPPDNIRYDKLSRMDILLDGYDLDNVDDSVTRLAMILRAFVVMLQRFKSLPLVCIQFRDAYDELRGQRLWCHTPPYDWQTPYNQGDTLAALRGSKTPLVTYLLLTLLDLPVCRGAYVRELEGTLHLDKMESIEGLPGLHDYEFMMTAFEAVERWLGGDRTTSITLLLTQYHRQWTVEG